MRKFCAVIRKTAVCALSILFVVFAFNVGTKPFFSEYEGIAEMYFENGSFTEGIESERDFKKTRFFCGKKGEGILTSETEAEKMIADFNAELVFSEEICGGENAYYYSEKLPFSAKVKGKTVNLQIYRKEGKVKAGTPLIYGSF